jgi:hypothetical protein
VTHWSGKELPIATYWLRRRCAFYSLPERPDFQSNPPESDLSDFRGVQLSHHNIVSNIEQAAIMAFCPTPYLDYQKNPDVFREQDKVMALCHTPLSHVSVPPDLNVS